MKNAKGLLEEFAATSFRDPKKAAEMFTAKPSKTGRTIHELFFGRLVAENGKLKLLRESVNLAEVALGVFPNGLADYKVPSEHKASRRRGPTNAPRSPTSAHAPQRSDAGATASPGPRPRAGFAGMIGVTLFGIFLTPVFFYVIRRVAGQRTPAPVMETIPAAVMEALVR